MHNLVALIAVLLLVAAPAAAEEISAEADHVLWCASAFALLANDASEQSDVIETELYDSMAATLTQKGIDLGCVGLARDAKFTSYAKSVDDTRSMLKSLSVTPKEGAAHGLMLNQDGQRRTAYELLSYRNQSLKVLTAVWPELGDVNPKVAEALEIESTYSVYM
ncbi:MAG: tRNA uridine-5-carboxymethylaminomethyl(34) synthesis enzyme MnmG, partial [Hyphomicrobiales bacterium]